MTAEVTHFYTSQHWANNAIKIACTGKWIKRERGDSLRAWYVGNGTTSPRQVTCQECLRIVIGKQEEKLDELKERYRTIFGPVTIHGGQTLREWIDSNAKAAKIRSDFNDLLEPEYAEIERLDLIDKLMASLRESM